MPEVEVKPVEAAEVKPVEVKEAAKVEEKAAPVTKAKKSEPAVLELEDHDTREHMNVVFIGHVDAGKSTISGNILYLTGMVDKRLIEKFSREAKERNRDSWFLAFIMDTNDEESDCRHGKE